MIPKSLTWTLKNGTKVNIDELDDRQLVEVITEMQKLAEIKRRAIVAVYQEFTGISSQYTKTMADLYNNSNWTSHVDGIYSSLIYEAGKRELPVPLEPKLEEDLQIPLTRRGSLERQIVGALRDCIKSHGPVTVLTAPSAAKRVIGAIRYHNRRVST